ncbi:MAG: hypothetical protein V1661_02565 [bacterium]
MKSKKGHFSGVHLEDYEAKGPEANELRLAIAESIDEAVMVPAQGPEADELILAVAEDLDRVYYEDIQIIYPEKQTDEIIENSADEPLENAFFNSDPGDDNWEILAAISA